MSLRRTRRPMAERRAARVPGASVIIALAVALLVAGCRFAPEAAPPTKDLGPLASDVGTGGGPPTSTPDASGVVPGCPITLAEAHAAVPEITRGPDLGVPFKNVTGSCQFWFGLGVDPAGRPLGITLLVFDTEGQGVHLWDSVRTAAAAFANVTDVAGVGDMAIVAGGPAGSAVTDLFAVKGQIGLHIEGPQQGLRTDQYVALARAAYARLAP